MGTRIPVKCRLRNILTKVEPNTKSTGFKASAHVWRSGPVLQAGFTHHQALPRGTDPQQDQDSLFTLLVAKSTHKSFIVNSQMFSRALFLRAQGEENQV